MSARVLGIDIGSQGGHRPAHVSGRIARDRGHADLARWPQGTPERLGGATGGHRRQHEGRDGLRRIRRRATRGKAL
jgi:hypothetical protein